MREKRSFLWKCSFWHECAKATVYALIILLSANVFIIQFSSQNQWGDRLSLQVAYQGGEQALAKFFGFSDLYHFHGTFLVSPWIRLAFPLVGFWKLGSLLACLVYCVAVSMSVWFVSRLFSRFIGG